MSGWFGYTLERRSVHEGHEDKCEAELNKGTIREVLFLWTKAESLYSAVSVFMQLHQLSFALQSGAELSL